MEWVDHCGGRGGVGKDFLKCHASFGCMEKLSYQLSCQEIRYTDIQRANVFFSRAPSQPHFTEVTCPTEVAEQREVYILSQV